MGLTNRGERCRRDQHVFLRDNGACRTATRRPKAPCHRIRPDTLPLGAGLTEGEVDWLVRNEFARTADDILWRRTKLGLRFNATETAALARILAR